jgi:hypothetical protein
LSSGRMLPLPQVKDKKPAVGAVRWLLVINCW